MNQEYDKDVHALCRELRRGGRSFGVIATLMGIPYTTVRNWVGHIMPSSGIFKVLPIPKRRKTFEDSKGKLSRKRCLIEDRGHRCEVCGLKEWLGKPIPLEMHHKDGNKRNWGKHNLQLCCPNCHVFTDNYKGKNIKKGRVAQMEEAQS